MGTYHFEIIAEKKDVGVVPAPVLGHSLSALGVALSGLRRGGKLCGLTCTVTAAGGCEQQSLTGCMSWTCWNPAGLRESLIGLLNV